MHRNPNDDSSGSGDDDDPRVAELVALRSMYPGHVECEGRDFEAAAEALESGGGCGSINALEEATQLARRPCRGAVRVAVATRTPAGGRNSAATSEDDGGGEGKATTVEAELHFELPPGYPFAQSAPARCRAACDALPRRALDVLSLTLQSVADAADADGRGECLHELVGVLEEGVQSALALAAAVAAEEALTVLSLSPQQQQQQQQQQQGMAGQHGACSAAAAAGPSRAPPDGGDAGTLADSRRRRVVLRLAHMRDRAGYLRTMRRWAKELGLAGRLVACGGRVFVALEGSDGGISEYLVRARTRNVDVDSAGRKCRERLMDIVHDGPVSDTAAADGASLAAGCIEEADAAAGGSSGGGGVAAAVAALGVDEPTLLGWLGVAAR